MKELRKILKRAESFMSELQPMSLLGVRQYPRRSLFLSILSYWAYKRTSPDFLLYNKIPGVQKYGRALAPRDQKICPCDRNFQCSQYNNHTSYVEGIKLLTKLSLNIVKLTRRDGNNMRLKWGYFNLFLKN